MSTLELAHTTSTMSKAHLDKAQRLAEAGILPFGFGVTPTISLSRLVAHGAGAAGTVVVRVDRLHRAQSGFELTVFDAISSVKAVCGSPTSGETAVIVENLDPGDIVAVTGELLGTPTELTMQIQSLALITKCLRPLPTLSEWSTTTLEDRRLHREVDILLRPEVRERFIARSRANSLVRAYLEREGFLEVETPLLVPFPEIAPVRPFSVEEPRWTRRMDLRITNTEYIRRLMVAGFERVYQLGKCFRDEELSYKHDVEFTQLTFGFAHHDYRTLMNLIENIIFDLATALTGTPIVTFRGQQIDLTPPWRRLTIQEAIERFTGLDIGRLSDPQLLSEQMVAAGLGVPTVFEYQGYLRHARLLDYLVDNYVLNHLSQPTFLHDYPDALGGPAKELVGRPGYKQRCEAFIAGMEIANVSTPQNDPLRVRKWYQETIDLKVQSGWKHQQLDDPYLMAIETGIPICATGAIGYERMLMLVLGVDDIRDVGLFTWKGYKA